VAIAALILAVSVAVWYSQRCPSVPGDIVFVECSHVAGNEVGNLIWWKLELDANGNGTLTVSRAGAPDRRGPVSAPKTIDALQNAIAQWPFCDLSSQIGGAVPDSSTDKMRIKTENFDKAVTIQFVDPRNIDDDVRHVNELWTEIQDCVDRSMPLN